MHIGTPKLTFVQAVPRSRWLSLAGGVAVAYVFMHLLPELAEHERTLRDGAGEAGAVVYALSLAGLVTFYGLERLIRQSRERMRQEGRGDRADAGTFWLHISSFATYNLLIGYLLLHRGGRMGSSGAVLHGDGAAFLHQRFRPAPGPRGAL